MFEFEITQRSYAIELEHDSFLDLLDSESYVTENAAFAKGKQTLSEKLNVLPGVFDTDYNGHFGSAIYLKIDDEDDTDDLKKNISKIIKDHLKWCSKLKKRESVILRRKEDQNAS